MYFLTNFQEVTRFAQTEFYKSNILFWFRHFPTSYSHKTRGSGRRMSRDGRSPKPAGGLRRSEV